MLGPVEGSGLGRPEIYALQPYQADGISCSIKLDANENGWDVPQEIKDIFFERVAQLSINRYPDAAWTALRAALSKRHGVSPEQILIGNGSSELILALMQAFVGTGRRVVYPTPSFAMYSIYATIAGATSVPISLDTHFKLDPNTVIAQSTQSGTGLVILCSPNNPTGNAMALAEIEKIVANSPCVVAVDEAYFEFHGETALPLVEKYSNLIILRTFSKAYGLAAARVGYLIGQRSVVEQVAKVILPYNVNMLSLILAEVMLSWPAVSRQRILTVIAERERVTNVLRAIPGVSVFPSRTNFILFKTSLESKFVAQQLLQVDIGIKDFGKYIPQCLRVTIGTPVENDGFLQALRSIITGVI